MIDTRMKCIRLDIMKLLKLFFCNQLLQQNLNAFGNKFWVPPLILLLKMSLPQFYNQVPLLSKAMFNMAV